VGDGELRERLGELADESGSSDRIVFAGFRDDLTAVYSAFDLYAHSSIEGGGETFPFAVLQALAQELPVVVTNVGDVARMVEEGVNGFVVADKDPSLLAGAMVKALRDPSIRGHMAEASYDRFQRDFTLGKMTDRIEIVYDSVLHPPA
jgi:glycosyltransferase involved in cell wall biosynthesis